MLNRNVLMDLKVGINLPVSFTVRPELDDTNSCYYVWLPVVVIGLIYWNDPDVSTPSLLVH